jgi:hypothetical protein
VGPTSFVPGRVGADERERQKGRTCPFAITTSGFAVASSVGRTTPTLVNTLLACASTVKSVARITHQAKKPTIWTFVRSAQINCAHLAPGRRPYLRQRCRDVRAPLAGGAHANGGAHADRRIARRPLDRVSHQLSCPTRPRVAHQAFVPVVNEPPRAEASGCDADAVPVQRQINCPSPERDEPRCGLVANLKLADPARQRGVVQQLLQRQPRRGLRIGHLPQGEQGENQGLQRRPRAGGICAGHSIPHSTSAFAGGVYRWAHC